MPLDHHGRAIADVIPTCIEQDVKYLGEYLDSRFKVTKQLRKSCRVDKKKLKVDPENEEQNFYTSKTDLWPDTATLNSMLFDENDHGDEVVIEILDIPMLHNPNDKELSGKTAEALSEMDETDIFGYRAVQAIVNFRWGITKNYVLKKQMLPYICFFTTYLIYVFILFDMDQQNEEAVDEGKKASYTIIVTVIDTLVLLALFAFSIFFLFNELVQMSKLDKWYSYFKDVWNYTDVVPPAIIICLIALDLAF